MKMILMILALVVMLAAVSSGAATTTGLHGLVTKGPTQPVCRIDQPCEAPAKGVTLTFVKGSLTRSTTTDATGRYTISLAPGSYSVRIAGARFGYTPRTATVIADRMKRRNFSIDTGIR